MGGGVWSTRCRVGDSAHHVAAAGGGQIAHPTASSSCYMVRGTGLAEVDDMKARVSLNLPRSLKKAAEDFAAKEGVSLNQYVALALAEKVGASGAAEFFAERGKGGDPRRAVAFLKGRPEEGGVCGMVAVEVPVAIGRTP